MKTINAGALLAGGACLLASALAAAQSAPASASATDPLPEEPAAEQRGFARLLDPLDPPDKRSLWIDSGFATRHFNRNRNLNGANHGAGAEYQIRGDLALSAGRFTNSDREWSTYAGVLWQPYTWNRWRYGVVAAAFNGYPRMRHGGWFPALIPAATYDYERVGINIGFVPSYKDRLYGGISVQLKFRVWN